MSARTAARIFVVIHLLCLSLAAERAHARKFDFKNESVATYFRGTYGPSQVFEAMYGESSGTAATTFDQKVKTNWSGEFGVVFATKVLNLRLAAELLLPTHISDVRGSDASGTELFTLDTKTSALIPTAYVDVNLYQTPTSKVYIGAGVGYAYLKNENQYAFTSAGSATFAIADYFEKTEAQMIAAHGYAGYEHLFTDNVTILIDMGYRYLPIRKLTHLQSATTLTGTVERGDVALKNDNGAREVDLSGAYVGLGFRFYIGI